MQEMPENPIPLAERLRPACIAEIIGQAHLLGSYQPLALAIASGQPHSMLFWGPPGVGKTTLARLLAQAFKAEFLALSAVFAGVKDIREAMQQATHWRSQGKITLLFVDEVHRFNKAQQDAFLPFVENGTVYFIGATTENPSFALNAALLSRAQLYTLQPLDAPALQTLLYRGIHFLHSNLTLQADAEALLIQSADGDGRRLLNHLEQIHHAASAQQITRLDASILHNLLASRARQFDKNGDHFYEQISALHKSVRGSHPDAALYWLCRMLDGGADPLYVGRRLIRMATEDIGLADPRALEMTLQAVQTYERLGSPEGELALAQATLYLAIAAKSNAVYLAYQTARALIKQDISRPVPLHLRNAPTKLMQKMDYGQGYRYAHHEENAYAAGENYLPDGIQADFYTPSGRGLEAKIKEKLAYLRTLDADAIQTQQNKLKPQQ